MMQPRLTFALVLPILLSIAAAQAGEAEQKPGAAVDSALSEVVSPRTQSEVLVFGSWHTAGLQGIEPRHMQGVLDALDRFAPTRIAVEALPPDEVALLFDRARAQPAAAQQSDRFGKRIGEPGRAMQAAMGVDRFAAEARALELLASAGRDMAPDTRGELIRNLLAAYDFYSAALQWTYLTPAQRRDVDLPDAVRKTLDERLQSKDEINIVATALARRHGLQRLYPIDSQYEAVRTLGFPEETADAVFGHESVRTWRDSPEGKRIFELAEGALEPGGMLELARKANSVQVQEEDATQWRAWLAMDHPSGLDRFRYAMWELRNARMASNVLDAAASTRPERVLVVVGLSHKSYLDRELADKLALRLVQIDELDNRQEP
jgi:hypothetical protein